ncbi:MULTISPECIES: carboxypeptidase-like regulatory domain-containing protein [Clostridium]|uniref:Carboxypeptidase regulatory-like domain-containing protein n=1 Tax=Clostridium cibarium TaxID=2762247 RepID=A0ABR8PUU3_9CLOT|nr:MULTISPECIES: carboxypeptidase-like regulatory domain-containing protein [Clostridium]MBD7911903.1 carboxypeptidase regulatory-like domain-containing protein [Clostridium cibarium]
MLIEDKYILKDSNPFKMQPYEEATINLELEKNPPCYSTLLTGRVFDRDSPISNATVAVFDRNLNPLFHTTTNEEGIYNFINVLNPGEYKVVASAKYYSTSTAKCIVLRPNDVYELSFSLKTNSALLNGLVYGKILMEGRNMAIPDAIINLKSSDDPNKIIYRTTSNNNGQYIIYDILPYKYIMEVKKVGYLPFNPIELTVETYKFIPLNVNLIRDSSNSTGTISGTILSHKVPVSNTAVFLYSLNARGNETIVQVQVTNKYGVYLFSDVSNGSYMVKCKLQNGEDFQRNITI